MFNIFNQDKSNQLQNIFDVLTIDCTKLQLSKLAIEKAVGMISNAVAKSEIVIQRKDGRCKDEHYYRLNVRPNDNETGTDFWRRVVRKMLLEEDCKICRTSDNKYYIVYNCTESQDVMKAKSYSDVTVECDGKTYHLDKTFTADQMIVLKYDNTKLRNYLRNVVNLYDETLAALNNMKKLSSAPKFRFKVDGSLTLKEKNTDGTDRTVTKDEYVGKLNKLLGSEDLSILTLSTGMDLDQIKVESNVNTDDITKLAKEVNSECSMAFDIPSAVFFGNITEKSDATNEFITFAVSPPVEVINDSLNAKLVGQKDYIAGERIFIWLARFKHVDLIDCAANLEKLRGIGYNLDEIREMTGYEPLNTDFSTSRAFTKNFAVEDEEQTKGGGESGK